MGISGTATSTGWDVLDTALGLLRDAAAAVGDGDRDRPTPCERWTVAQVLFHATYDQFAWASSVDGGPSPEVDPFDPPAAPELSPTALVDSAVARAVAAWSTVSPDLAVVPTPLPAGPMSPEAAARACALDAAVHAWDVTTALGRPRTLPDALAAELLPVARTFVEPLRQWGAFAAALPQEAPEGSAAELLRYLGRNPHWQP
jgi:uncharacterized protein (TIGR03086 family)